MSDPHDLPIFRARFGSGRRPGAGGGGASFRNAVLSGARILRPRGASGAGRPGSPSRIAVRPPGAHARRVVVKAHYVKLSASGAKAAAFLSLSQWLPLNSVEFAWCRLFYLFGEGEDERRLVPYLRMKLAAGEPVDLTSGNQIRDFLDISEAGRQIAKVALNDRTGAVNICSGVPITVRQMAERVADEYGRRDLLKFGVRPDNIIDPPCVVGLK